MVVEIADLQISHPSAMGGFLPSGCWLIPFLQSLTRCCRIWDESDYVVPPAENGAFFVTTNMIVTPNQTQGACPEDGSQVRGARCRPDNNTCVKGAYLHKSHGLLTGRLEIRD